MRGGGSNVASVSLCGIEVAEIVDESDTSITVIAAQSTKAISHGDVVITSESGAIIVQSKGWSYVVPGHVSSVKPALGQFGTRVTLSGKHLIENNVGVHSVKLAGVLVNEVTFASDTEIRVIAAEASNVAGTNNIVLKSGASITSEQTFTYIHRGVIDTVSDNAGKSAGQEGTKVTISGQNLLGGGSTVYDVTLAGTSAQLVKTTKGRSRRAEGKMQFDIQVVANRPSDTDSHTGNVVVISDTGASTTKINGWTYLAHSAIFQLNPSSGQYNTRVDIQGLRLFGGAKRITSVTLADIPAIVGTDRKSTRLNSSH